jgi:thiol-disulfide isomerase/thioredoxin
MRWFSLTLLSVLMVCLASGAESACQVDTNPHGFAGTWKLSLTQRDKEISPWILKIDKSGKSVTLVAGFNNFAKSKISTPIVRGDSLLFSIDAPSPDTKTSATYQIRIVSRAADTLTGSLRQGNNFAALWLDKTDAEDLTDKTAVRPAAGFSDLEAATKLTDASARLKELLRLADEHKSRQAGQVAAQIAVTQLSREKGSVAELRPFVERYVKMADNHGPDFGIATRMTLAQTVAGVDKVAPLLFELAKGAADQTDKTTPAESQLAIRLVKTIGLDLSDKKDEIPAVVKEMKSLADAEIEAAKGDAKFNIVGRTAAQLMASKIPAVSALGLEYGRATVKLLKPDAPPTQKLNLLASLAAALEKTGEKDEAATLAKEADKTVEALLATIKDEKQRFQVARDLAGQLLNSPSRAISELGLDYSRKAVKLLPKDATLADRLGANKLLGRALRMRGNKDEADKFASTLNKLEEEADAEYLKDNIPFKVTPSEGRKGKSKRVVLVEMFTGAQCLPCVAADIAFDAAQKTYKNSEVVFLQNHVHIPLPDPLTNLDSEARAEFYGSEIEGAPAIFVDGKVVGPAGGAKQRGKVVYDLLCAEVDKALEKEPEATLKVEVSKKGETITVNARVLDLKEPGAAVRLRIALVEQSVRYQGRNGQRLHTSVVRALLGGKDGFKLEKKEADHFVNLKIEDLRKALDQVLTETATARNILWAERPLDLKNLAIIAFIQEQDSKKVLQAIRVSVPD